jgi:YD repeat-containing protein
MPTMTCGNGAFTPSTSGDNWTLDSQSAGVFGKVVAIGWGGRLTTSTGYRTRWTRPTTIGSGTFTALTSAFHQPNYATFGSRIGTFATQPVLATDPAGNLWAQDWNAQGGLGMIVMPLANPWWFVNGILTGQISNRNIAGTDANGSSYEVTVEE